MTCVLKWKTATKCFRAVESVLKSEEKKQINETEFKEQPGDGV